jgi:hypothetical protein
MVAADAGATKPAAASAALPETKVRLFKIFLLGTDPRDKEGQNHRRSPAISGATAPSLDTGIVADLPACAAQGSRLTRGKHRGKACRAFKTRERFTAVAGFPAYGTPEQFAAFVNQQIALWKGVIDKEGPKLDVT